MKSTSTWLALRNPVFRHLWIANLVSGTCVAAHDAAATWAMNSLSMTPLSLSLMSTVASLPFFLFTMPAGALADLLNRRRLLTGITFWLAASAGLLAILAALRCLNPYVLLACVFLIGVGFAFNAPVWSSIQPDIVSDEELPSAATLGGLQLNLSGIVGPAIGGFLLPWIHPAGVFALNACCFLLVINAVRRVPRRAEDSGVPLENFVDSFLVAVRYARYTPGVRVILLRNMIFSAIIAVIPALLPVVSLKELHLPATSLGLVFTFMGVGSVAGAVVILPMLRQRFCSNSITIIAMVLLGAALALIAVAKMLPIFLLSAMLTGTAWTIAAAELWVAGQRAMPSWARGRLNATVITVSQGAIALGGILWGAAASTIGIQTTVFVAAAVAFTGVLVVRAFSIDFTSDIHFIPGRWGNPKVPLTRSPRPQDGPVAVHIEIQIDREGGAKLMPLVREARLIQLRNGAFSYQMFEDLTRPNIYRFEMMYPSWTEYKLVDGRLTKEEREVIDAIRALHVGPQPIQYQYFLSTHREVKASRHPVARPSSMPEAPLAVERAARA